MARPVRQFHDQHDTAVPPVRAATGSPGRGRTDSDAVDAGVKSADRVLAVLDLLAERGPSTFSEIVSALGLPNSSAHNLLQTMIRRDYLEFDAAARRYRLGLRLWQVAQAYVTDRDVVSVARPLMEEVVRATGETVQLARLDGVENVYLAISESPHPMKLVSRVGARLHAHATGLGKALLASLPAEEARRRLSAAPLPRFTPNTITDVEALLVELASVRGRGYALDDEEYVIGCRCVAMPVRDENGQVVVAMSVSIPTPRHTPEIADRTREALRGAVSQLERRLGYMGEHAGPDTPAVAPNATRTPAACAPLRREPPRP